MPDLDFPTDWYHGSPLQLTSLRPGSTITPDIDLARVFSHKPNIVCLEDERLPPRLRHNGSQPGFLYRVVGVQPGAVGPHPRSSMPAGKEWLTERGLTVTLIGPTQVRPEEILSAGEIAKLRGSASPARKSE
jgi:hypothetical protein